MILCENLCCHYHPKHIPSMTYLCAYNSNLLFSHCVVFNHISQCSSFHIFHDDPQIALHQEAIQEIDNVFMLGFLHDHDLVDNQIQSRLFGQIHFLDCHLAIGCQVIGEKDISRSTRNILCQSFMLPSTHIKNTYPCPILFTRLYNPFGSPLDTTEPDLLFSDVEQKEKR